MKFKQGDRVISYGAYGKLKGTMLCADPNSLGRIVFKSDSGYIHECYPQQCRKLIRSKPRRQVWISEKNLNKIPDVNNDYDAAEIVVWNGPPALSDMVEFIEVRSKRK